MAKQPPDLQVDCLRHQSHPTPLVSLLSTQGRVGGGLGTCCPPPSPAVAGFLWPLLGIWKSLGNLKKIFFEEFVYFSPALPGSHSQEEEGKEGFGGVGDRVESHKRIRAPGKVGSTHRMPH